MTTLRVRGVAIDRGGRRIVDGVSFTAARGERVAIMGPSGSGKTTVLRGIAGLDRLAGGEVEVGRVGMVFQFHHLFEHLSAAHNVWLAPVHALKQPRADAELHQQLVCTALGLGARLLVRVHRCQPHVVRGAEVLE